MKQKRKRKKNIIKIKKILSQAPIRPRIEATHAHTHSPHHKGYTPLHSQTHIPQDTHTHPDTIASTSSFKINYKIQTKM